MFNLGETCSIFTAELYAILQALSIVLLLHTLWTHPEYVIRLSFIPLYVKCQIKRELFLVANRHSNDSQRFVIHSNKLQLLRNYTNSVIWNQITTIYGDEDARNEYRIEANRPEDHHRPKPSIYSRVFRQTKNHMESMGRSFRECLSYFWCSWCWKS